MTMAPPLKPTGFKPTFLRQCIDVLSAEPPVLRWRTRPRSHFSAGGRGDVAFRHWGKTLAGQTIRPGKDGRLRLRIAERVIDAKAIIAEIGVTPIGDLQRMPKGAPNDRLAATREVAGSGPLAAVMQAAVDETGRSMDDLMVMSADTDPYRMDTPAKHRIAQWFAAQVERFVAPDRRIHPRGVFYACVSAGDVRKPDGALFENTDEDTSWLNAAAKYARWLGYVPFERIADNKNDEPVVRPAPTTDDPAAHVWADDLDIEDLDPDSLGVSAGLADFEPRQPYRLVFFGEKTSLEDVLAPLAVEFSADLYLTGGQISDTLLHRMAQDAVNDGRPLAVITFSDFDPAGYWDMPAAIGRKLQALRDLKFPTLEFTVVHAALGPEQVRGLGLPSSPLKEGEKRAAKWLELYGSEQTEIDALATLRPDVLEQIAREAVAPYFDAGLRRRVTEAEIIWRRRVRAEIAGQSDEDRLNRLKARARDALDELQAVNADLAAIAAEIEIGGAADLPEADMDALSEAQDEHRDAVLIDSGMDFAEATDRLRAHNELAARRRGR